MRDKKDLGKNASENMLFLPRPLRYDLAWSGAWGCSFLQSWSSTKHVKQNIYLQLTSKKKQGLSLTSDLLADLHDGKVNLRVLGEEFFLESFSSTIDRCRQRKDEV